MKNLWMWLLALVAGVILLIAIGSPSGQKLEPAASTPAPAAAPPSPAQPRQTLKKTTQNVLELSKALADGGVRADLSIKSQGLEIVADAYRTSVGKVSILAVDQKMNLFQAENDRKPRDHAEFMDRILEKDKPDGIMLPMLPYYQEYAYDPEAKELVVIEFPARKEQRQQEVSRPFGQ